MGDRLPDFPDPAAHGVPRLTETAHCFFIPFRVRYFETGSPQISIFFYFEVIPVKSKSKLLIVVLIVAVIAWFAASNVFFSKYSGTFYLSEEYTSVAWTVLEGEGEKFQAKLDSPKKLTVTYNGTEDLRVSFSMVSPGREEAIYELVLANQYDSASEDWRMTPDFTKIG